MGIQCDFPGYDTLYILGVYLPSSSLNIEVYDEYFDYMSALYESSSSRGIVRITGDFNGDLGISLGHKGKREPNLRGLKLLDFANYFNPIAYGEGGIFIPHHHSISCHSETT